MMAASIAPAELHAQRAMEREISKLLRRIRNPKALPRLALVQSLCRQTGARDPVEALERVVRSALAGNDLKTAALRSAILDVNFAPRITNAVAAQRRGISRRHLQRRRANAVAAVARHVRDLCGSRDGQLAVVGEGSNLRTARSAYESEYAAYIRAREGGDALQTLFVATNLRRIADKRSRSHACGLVADASLRLGRIDQAFAQRDVLPPAAGELLDAKFSFLHGDLADAHAKAASALETMPVDDPQRYDCLVLVSEVMLARGSMWIPPADAARPERHSWKATAVDAQWARHLGRMRLWGQSERVASSVWERAVASGYLGPAARSAATLHRCARARADRASERRWRAEAIQHLLRTQDFLMACGLFVDAAYDADSPMDALLAATLYRRLCAVVPQMHGETPSQRAAVVSLLTALIDRIVAVSVDDSRLVAAVAAVARDDCALVYYLDKVAQTVAEMLALSVIALAKLPWEGAMANVLAALAGVAEKIRPTKPKAIPIVLPHWAQSQLTGINHLRVDEPPARRRGSVAALPSIRIRFLPVRSGTGTALARRLGRPAARSSFAPLGAAGSR
ncbi:MAG TPA: hypothetical protein VFF63_00490 [Candidatus Babeliales bacterium]|nr:hypothetical protein [Candidatus Babeliales bacterium]